MAAARTTTFAFRCTGASQPGCGLIYRTEQHPEQDEALVVSDGVCDECLEVEIAELDRLDPLFGCSKLAEG